MISWKFELTQDEGDLEEGREGEAIDRPGNFFSFHKVSSFSLCLLLKIIVGFMLEKKFQI